MKREEYPVIYRLIHWSIAICFMLLLITIFLRMNWMSQNHIADTIRKFLQAKNQSLPDDQIKTLARLIRKPMWDWHFYLGYILTGLFAVRMILPFFGQMTFSNPFKKEIGLKSKFQFLIYWFFYVFAGTSLFTGLMIEFGPLTLKHSMAAIHVLSIYYLVPYIIIHITGVLIAELSDQQGIISRTISEGKRGNLQNSARKRLSED
jgi:cytochrome b561